MVRPRRASRELARSPWHIGSAVIYAVPTDPRRSACPVAALSIAWEGSGHSVFMTGPAERVFFEGDLEIRDILAADLRVV